MTSELDVINRVRARLVALGYPDSSLTREHRVHQELSVDLLARFSGQAWLAVETKRSLSLLEEKSAADLRFDPLVRSLQRRAVDLGAPYLLLSDGSRELWFKIDEAGRPALLGAPVYPPETAVEGAAQIGTSSSDLSRALFQMADRARSIEHRGDGSWIPLSLLARIRRERGDPRLEVELTSGDHSGPTINELIEKAQFSSRPEFDTGFFMDGAAILSDVSLGGQSPELIMAALDQLLMLRLQPAALKLPRWLTDFLVQLCRIADSDVVVDAYSDFGDVAAAVAARHPQTRVISIARSAFAFLWSVMQHELLNLGDSKVVMRGTIPALLQSDQLMTMEPTKVIVTPPFGTRIVNSNGVRAKAIEHEYLSFALESVAEQGHIVAMIPETFFLSNRFRVIRQDIAMRTQLKIVVGLDAMLSYTHAKASIIRFQKANPSDTDRVVVANITQSDIPQEDRGRVTCDGIERTTQILAVMDETGNRAITYPRVRLLPVSGFLERTHVIDDYLVGDQTSNEIAYNTFPLREIAKLSKGSHLTLSRSGHLSVLGPAAIRRFAIANDALDRTSEERLPPNTVRTRTGDVVVNAVGKYRGQAALIGEPQAHLPVSRNVIVVRVFGSKLTPAYLVVALNSSFVARQVQGGTRGVVIPQITIGSLADVEIPVPPIEVQKEIVSRIGQVHDELLAAEADREDAGARFDVAEQRLDTLLNRVHALGGME